MDSLFQIESDDTAELDDRSKLFYHIIYQAIEDYTKLQHPTMRQKRYLEEAFCHANDMLFDETFQFLSIYNDDGQHMSFPEMLQELFAHSVDIEKLQTYLVTTAKTHWENRTVQTIKIPENVIIDGHCYVVNQETEEEPHISFDEKIIKLDKNQQDTYNQEEFCRLLVQIVCMHEEIPMSKSNMDKLGRGLFRLLRLNDCFNGER
jgi:hypothetical protein